MRYFVFACSILWCSAASAQGFKQFPMWNTSLSFEQRINDLVSRLTLEEKVAQMLNATPAIPRLGIPAYDWWNEVLHGVARTPFKVTSYPQAIAMAATWDTTALKLMAEYSAKEGRAIHNKAIAMGRTGDRYLGLTYWTPNINIFRDPRWGRGQETYGEDPFLTANLGSAFVRGLQGNDPKYLLAAACAKHYAVHSGPEPSRHADNFNPSAYDLWDTYLPAFKQLIVNAKVSGVMCAYNAVDTQPCCANDQLMNDILRRQWKFTGYVTSDCWAIDDFFRYHKTHKDSSAAAVDAVLHGTDIECGRTVYFALIHAVQQHLIEEAQLDISLKRLFMVRYRLGMFDPPEMVAFTQVPASTLEAPEHKALALKMAREAIVLLRNEKATLPLKKSIKKIAVVGPNADNPIMVLGNYNGTPSKVISLLQGIREKLGPDAEVVYQKAVNFTTDTMFVVRDAFRMVNQDGKPGVQVAYFANETLSGSPVIVQQESSIDHEWPEGTEPLPGLPATHFSARFTASFTGRQNEMIHFETEGNDGYRVWINDELLVDLWEKNRWGAKQFNLPVQKDSVYRLVLEYRQAEGDAMIKLRAGDYVKTDFEALAAQLKDADAIVFAGGISPQLEGEEMPVNMPGFNGGDRTSILLPEVQTKCMQALQKTGKPLVFVLCTGSAIAMPWEAQNIPAIVNAWYGGQSAGTALADVLFGDDNPAGRLPVTFYKSDADLPAFSNYNMEGRTYRYFKGDVLYPFGFGLSYTSFTYSNLKTSVSLAKGKTASVSVTITNTGNLPGDEVLQLYVSHNAKQLRVPLRSLKGFRRIHLKAGEEQVVHFTLTAEDLSLVNAQGNTYWPKGKMILSVGGGQPGVKQKTSGNVLQRTLTLL